MIWIFRFFSVGVCSKASFPSLTLWELTIFSLSCRICSSMLLLSKDMWIILFSWCVPVVVFRAKDYSVSLLRMLFCLSKWELHISPVSFLPSQFCIYFLEEHLHPQLVYLCKLDGCLCVKHAIGVWVKLLCYYTRNTSYRNFWKIYIRKRKISHLQSHHGKWITGNILEHILPVFFLCKYTGNRIYIVYVKPL